MAVIPPATLLPARFSPSRPLKGPTFGKVAAGSGLQAQLKNLTMARGQAKKKKTMGQSVAQALNGGF
jgi:hypothetical protein